MGPACTLYSCRQPNALESAAIVGDSPVGEGDVEELGVRQVGRDT